MKKIIIVSMLAISSLILVGAYLGIRSAKDQAKSSSEMNGQPVSSNEVKTGAESAAQTNAVTVAPVQVSPNVSSSSDKLSSQSNVIAPMDNFNGRITLNAFGNEPSKMQLDANQYSDYVCAQGKGYAGFHTGVDLEVTPEERNQAVSVYSIADGTVRQASAVNGYGGLVVVEYNINGQIYTAYYGHIDLSTVKVKAGGTIKKGDKVAELAPGCSTKNGNTRKHLHFGLHKGKSVVVAGYVTNKADLSNWVDPRGIIK